MDDDNPRSLFNKCRLYLTEKESGDGKQLGALLRTVASPSKEEAQDLLQLAIASSRKDADDLAAAVISTAGGIHSTVEQLLESPTRTFKGIWSLGRISSRALVTHLLLEPRVWSSQDHRKQAEIDIFTLLVAKLLEPGVDFPEIALFSIARLLARDWDILTKYVDSDVFNLLFDFLDSDEKNETRSQATLALAKLFDHEPDRVANELDAFTKAQVATKRASSLALTCSVVATLFPVMPAVTSKMVLQEGFIPVLLQLVEEKRDAKLRLSALDLLSAACMDGPCRKAIRQHCDDWAWRIVDDNKYVRGSREGALAALLVSKLRAEQQDKTVENHDLVQMLKDLTTADKTFDQALEALSYQAIQPSVKKAVADDQGLLNRIMQHLTNPAVSQVQLYTGFQLFAILTRYTQPISEEQRKLMEVKAYADGAKPPKTHPLDEDEPVSARCKQVLDAGIAPAFVNSYAKASSALLILISEIMCSLSKHPKHRGLMVQQGLLDVCIFLGRKVNEFDTIQTPGMKRNAGLAIARILIPLDPTLVFSKRPIESVLDPLTFLLRMPAVSGDSVYDERWWRGFPVLNTLQALSNIATLQGSTPESADLASRLIINSAWNQIEDLWQSDIPAIRTAATELILNLTQSEAGFSKFVSDDAKLSHRFRIMTAYFGDSEFKLRLAAGGALAGLVCTRLSLNTFLDMPHGMEYLAEALADDDEGMRTRAVVILSGICQTLDQEKDLKEKAKASLVKQNIPAAITAMKKNGTTPAGMSDQLDRSEKFVTGI